MRNQLICLIFLLITSKLYSQFDYRPGFIILNSADTLYGMLDFKNDLSNSHHVYFKTDSSINAIEYTPDQIVAYYYVDGKYYVSKDIKLSKQDKRVFLEVLINGKVNVLYGVIEDDYTTDIISSIKAYYFVEKENELVEINNDLKIAIDSNGKQYFKESNQYKGVLKYFFNDSPNILKNVEYTEFNQKALLNIAKDYHEQVCPDLKCIVYNKTLSKNKYLVGFEYNYILPKLDFYTYESIVISKAPPETIFSMGLMGAINIDYDYRFWFQVNVKYQHQSFTDSSLFRDIYPMKHNYEFSSIFMDLSIKHNFLLTKLKPYLMAGPIVGYLINEKHENSSIIHTKPGYADDEDTLFGFKAGSGLEYDFTSNLNIYISVDYIFYATMTKLRMTGLSFNTGISFVL